MNYSFPLILVALLAADPVPPNSPAEQLVQLAKEGNSIHETFYAELTKAGRDMPKVSAANDKGLAYTIGHIMRHPVRHSLTWLSRE